MWVPRWVRRTFFRCRHVVSRGGHAPLLRLTVRQVVMDHTCCCRPACRAETSLSAAFFPQRPSSTPFCRRSKQQQLWWTDLYRGMKLSSASTTSVRFYLAAFLQNSAGTQICRWFFPLHKQTCRAKPSQAADRWQCQMHKKKRGFCTGLSCAVRRDVFSAKRLNKTAGSFFSPLGKAVSFLFGVWKCVS